MPVVISVPRETLPGEQRVSLVPDTVKKLTSLGATVRVQSGAGELAGYSDGDYKSASATIAGQDHSPFSDADIVLTVNPPVTDHTQELRKGSIIIGFLNPYSELDRFHITRDRHVSAFSMEMIPRISRAQAMDALSSQASIAGYKAVLIASSLSGKFFPMLTTAAGTVRPSKVLVIGAGVAGLQAIATARRLGAIVEAYDVRVAVKEQVESLGARFVDVGVKADGAGGYARELTDEEKAQQQEVLARHVAAADVVITTAAIPGRPAPRIITREMVEGMKGGAVIVDLAAEGGGNCELTRAGETVVHNQVIIHGPLNVPATVPNHASELYARNLFNVMELMVSNGQVRMDLQDQIIKDSLITHAGEIVHEGVQQQLNNT